MSDDSLLKGSRPSTVNLVRSSHSWTQADSAAGFVLRYLTPMREHLTEVLGSEQEADQALKLLLTHLVSAGFGDHKQGRLRDFLARAIRSCAKARLQELGRLSDDKSELSEVTPESREWLLKWRQCLLDRAWRALERMEHHDLSQPLYTVLWARSTNPKVTPEQIVAEVRQRTGNEVGVELLDALEMDAKAAFAQLLADEVVETLQSPQKDAVQKEIQSLGMGAAFTGVSVGA
ncbi:MAG: hypothetical protein AAFU85_01555 [Planctomycetota bacterium]